MTFLKRQLCAAPSIEDIIALIKRDFGIPADTNIELQWLICFGYLKFRHAALIADLEKCHTLKITKKLM